MLVKVESVRTPVDMLAMGRSLGLAWYRLRGKMPTRPAIDLTLGQYAQETGRGKSCFAFNVGNVKWVDGVQTDYCVRYCNELLTEKQAQDALSRAGVQVDGTPDVILGGVIGGLRIVNFYPPNPASRFRAFATLDEGCLDYLSILGDRFSAAWVYLDAGDADAFAAALHRARYYTAPESVYATGLRQLQREFSHLDIDLTPPPPEITGRLAADQDAAFRMFKPEDPTQ